MATLYIAIKTIIFLLMAESIFDFLYLDIHKKKTKYFTVGGLGATSVKVENKWLRWFLKLMLVGFLLFLLLNFPPLIQIPNSTLKN